MKDHNSSSPTNILIMQINSQLKSGIRGDQVMIKNILVLTAIAVIIIAVAVGFYASRTNNKIIISEEGKDPNMIELVIMSDGRWSATINDGESRSHSVDGFGNRSIIIPCDSHGMYSVVVQKSEGTTGTLIVEVVKDGAVSQKSSSSSANGVISLSGTC